MSQSKPHLNHSYDKSAVLTSVASYVCSNVSQCAACRNFKGEDVYMSVTSIYHVLKLILIDLICYSIQIKNLGYRYRANAPDTDVVGNEPVWREALNLNNYLS